MQQYFAQIKSKSDKKLWLKADIAFEQQDFYQAAILYDSLLVKDPKNQEIIYHLAICNFNLRVDSKKTINLFQQLNSTKFIEVNYYLGILELKNGKYDNALNHLIKYQSTHAPKEITADRIEHFIQMCHRAKIFEEQPDNNVRIINMGETINSSVDDYAPVVIGKENMLYFTSKRYNEIWSLKDKKGNFYEKIYVSHKINNIWQSPEILDSTINTSEHNAATNITPDGKKMLLYRSNMESTWGNIYETVFQDSNWSKPVKIDININRLSFAETSACFAQNDEILFFSSNRPGGYGGKDLYYVRKLPNGQWGVPFNLGPEINTPYNEDAPFIQVVGNELYFSSEGHNSMGGYDIFKSTFNEKGEFSKPINLGSPINTGDDDIFFVMNYNNTVGYFSSGRAGGFGGQDLYLVHQDYLKTLFNVYYVNIQDESGTILYNVELIIYDKLTKTKIGEYAPNKLSGRLVLIIEPDIEYEIQIISDHYKTLTTSFIFKDEKSHIFTLKN